MRVVLAEKEIKSGVERVAKEIANDMPEEFLLLGIMCGSFIFVSDLCRQLSTFGVRPMVNFARVSSYFDSVKPASEPKVTLPENLEADQPVLVVDDIADSGKTLSAVKQELKQICPKIKTCTLIVKASTQIVPDYYCFWLEDRFYVGYGLGLGNRYRHLPYLAELEPQ